MHDGKVEFKEALSRGFLRFAVKMCCRCNEMLSHEQRTLPESQEKEIY